MNFLFDDATKALEELQSTIKESYKLNDLIIAPPLPYLAALATKFPKINFACQDLSTKKDFGAHTGEVSAQIIRSSGANYAIIGHSDRRATLAENSEAIKTKISNSVDAGITPILCVGESLESRRNGEYIDFITSQLQDSLPSKNLRHLIIAYEPVWAIGSNTTPTLSEIAEIMDLIRNITTSCVVAKNISLVYGGSVDETNYRDILSVKDVSGILIGSASLNCAKLVGMLEGQ